MRNILKMLVGVWTRMRERRTDGHGKLAAATLQSVSHRQMLLPGIEEDHLDFRP